MGYNKSVYKTVRERFEKRRAAAFSTAAARREELCAKDRHISEIDAGIRAAALSLSTAIASGEKVDSARRQIDELRAEKAELLSTYNLPCDYLEPQFACKICGDRGEFEGGRCDCFLRELKIEAFRRTNLGGALSGQTFENFDTNFYPQSPLMGGTVRDFMKKVAAFCKKYADDFSEKSPSLLFTGATGLGKTHMSSAIAKVVSDAGFSVVYDTAGEIFSKLDDKRFGRGTPGAERDYFDCDLLIIDDLGSELTTSLTVAHLFSLINERMLHGGQMIISTNLTPDALRDRYEEKVASRIIGTFVMLQFYGADIRQKKRAN